MSNQGTSIVGGSQATARTTVKVALKENVDLEALTRIVAGIGGRYGCRTCGLLGIDLVLGGDPGDLNEIASLPGVQSVSV